MKLSKNFEDKEFFCPCKNCKKDKLPDDQLITLLQNLRDKIKRPIYIATGGGIRCKSYNNRIDGYVDSPHLKGKAADIYVNKFPYIELAKLALEIGFLRVGLYPESYSEFIHTDIVTPYPNQAWIKLGKVYTYYKTFLLALNNIKNDT